MSVVELSQWVPQDDKQLRLQSDWFIYLQRLFLGNSGCQLVERTIWKSLDEKIHNYSKTSEKDTLNKGCLVIKTLLRECSTN